MLAQRSEADSAVAVWEGIRQGYANALPGLAEMGLREAVYGDSTAIPAHLLTMNAAPGPEVELSLYPSKGFVHPQARPRDPGQRAYLDPTFNHLARVDLSFRCSLAVSRDWHRHRTMYPWSLDLVRENPDTEDPGFIRIHPGYEPKSAYARDHLPALIARSTEAYDAFMRLGNQAQAMLCLPLGTEVKMSGQGGLRDVVYMLELRGYAHGANFEYKKQALEATALLKAAVQAYQVKDSPGTAHLPIPIDIVKWMGFREG
jgi:hypothetical protein